MSGLDVVPVFCAPSPFSFGIGLSRTESLGTLKSLDIPRSKRRSRFHAKNHGRERWAIFSTRANTVGLAGDGFGRAKHTPGAKAPVFVSEKRPEPKGSGYLEARLQTKRVDDRCGPKYRDPSPAAQDDGVKRATAQRSSFLFLRVGRGVALDRTRCRGPIRGRCCDGDRPSRRRER